MSTYHTLPSGKIMYKVKGESVYSIYATDDRTHLVSLSGEDLLDMRNAVRLLNLADFVNNLDPETARSHREAQEITKEISSVQYDAHGGIIVTFTNGEQKYFEEK